MLFSPQIPLPLEPRREGRLDDFVVGPNRAAVDAVREVVAEPDASLYLRGPAASGKTFLLNAACLAAREKGMTAFYLGLKRLPANGAAALNGLENLDLVCIDDLHLIEGRPDWQTALFHLYNRLRDSGRQLILGARKSPRGLELELADLKSRLQWGLTFQLHPLSDADKLAALRQRSRLRGFDLPEDVAQYILHRAPRDTRALFACLEQLDRASLQAQRKITIPFVKQVLNI